MEKTCGNCGHGCYESTVYCDVSNCDMLVNCEACDDWIESKRQHIRCDKITQLEQRYQQLEQVARKMLKHLCSVCDGGDVYNEDIADYREGLEELGVEV